MLVKKIDPEWFPSENKTLAVGEVIDISDPKTLIIAGAVVAVTDGLEQSAYETYGVVTENDKKDFEEFVQYKKIKQLKEQQAKLQEEASELKEKIAEAPNAESDKKEPTIDPRLEALKKAREAKAAKKNA